MRGIHRLPVISPHKDHWPGALMFSLIYVWINNREAGDLRRHRTHCDVIVMTALWPNKHIRPWQKRCSILLNTFKWSLICPPKYKMAISVFTIHPKHILNWILPNRVRLHYPVQIPFIQSFEFSHYDSVNFVFHLMKLLELYRLWLFNHKETSANFMCLRCTTKEDMPSINWMAYFSNNICSE